MNDNNELKFDESKSAGSESSLKENFGCSSVIVLTLIPILLFFYGEGPSWGRNLVLNLSFILFGYLIVTGYISGRQKLATGLLVVGAVIFLVVNLV